MTTNRTDRIIPGDDIEQDGDSPLGVVPRSRNDLLISSFRTGLRRIPFIQPLPGAHRQAVERFDRATLLLLHTIGARTGQPRVSPLVFARTGDRYVIAATAGGRPRHPAWHANLLAHPRGLVELWQDDVLQTFGVIAQLAEDADRDALWAVMVTVHPGLADYARQTERTIPVFTLRRT
jgi:deazaflavin-dependent oxidoreductase (nitroreductase family)